MTNPQKTYITAYQNIIMAIRRHAHRVAARAAVGEATNLHRPGRPDISARPVIIANLTAVDVQGFLDVEEQPVGTVLLPTGITLTEWALQQPARPQTNCPTVKRWDS